MDKEIVWYGIYQYAFRLLALHRHVVHDLSRSLWSAHSYTQYRLLR